MINRFFTFEHKSKKMKILTINSLKGGTSKSTLALNLYYYYSLIGKKVALTDSDPQGSLSELFYESDRENVSFIYRDNLRDWNELREIPKIDLIIIDTAPYQMAELNSIFMISDFILIPFLASEFDLRAMNHTIELFYNSQSAKKELRGAVILTKAIHGTKYNSDALQAVKNYDLPILKTQMMQRIDYSRSLSEKKGIFSTDNVKAKREIKKIGAEILKLWTV